MKQISCYIIKLLLIGLLISSCKKDTLPNKAASEYFPNKVGNYWEYEVYDSSEARGTYSSYSRRYTVTVTIVGIKSLIGGRDITMWRYEYPWGSDTNYLRISEDTVKVYDKFRTETAAGLNYPLQIFLIPFYDKQRWDGKLLGVDSSSVTFHSSINTSFGSFSNVSKIYHHYIGPNIDYKDEYYFAPNIGFPKLHYNRYNLAPLNIELWQLKRYYLN
jgi:hypothetical protein